jgi:hypothetical protein
MPPLGPTSSLRVAGNLLRYRSSRTAARETDSAPSGLPTYLLCLWRKSISGTPRGRGVPWSFCRNATYRLGQVRRAARANSAPCDVTRSGWRISPRSIAPVRSKMVYAVSAECFAVHLVIGEPSWKP